MNNKGLTLIEVIAVLVVLSIIALIVTPNIADSIKEYKERTLETQLSNIEGALKNWTADNVDKVTCYESDEALYISISELQDGAYLDQNITNPYGGYLDDTDTFGLVSCKTISDDTNNISSNYKYSYSAYLDIDDYIKKMAIEYVKDNNNTSLDVTTDTLKSSGYIYTLIKKINKDNISIPSKTISVLVETIEEGKFKYKATIN